MRKAKAAFPQYSKLHLSPSESGTPGNHQNITALYEGHLGGPTESKFIWEKVERLKIENYDHNIEGSILSKCKGILTSAEFIGLTSLNNIYLILVHCPNLRQLVFNNVVLQYFESYLRYPVIKVNKLSEIVFQGEGKLTVEELQVLDFFHLRMRFKSLEAICFQTNTIEFDPSVRRKPGSYTDADANLNIFHTFIADYETRIKVLELNRADLQLIKNEGRSSSKFASRVVLKMDLNTLIANMGTVGFEKILISQRKLKVLHCYNTRQIAPRLFDQLSLSVEICQNFLQEIRLTYKFIDPPARASSSSVSVSKSQVSFSSRSRSKSKLGKMLPVPHDLCTYKSCRHLKKLNIDISMADYPDKTYIHPGELQNLTCIPDSISTLILRFDIISPRQMHDVTRKFSTMLRLKYFIFHGSPEHSYKVPMSWVQTLIKLPNLEIFELHFCQINQDSIDLLFSTTPSLRLKLEFTPASCIYWKNPVF
ncbi:unnamed protein product [Allacma fusca]|uniref:Uncharacterized protein n=1 Tax=Allacma fusca TaxID=39272 RepID=A0A8J2PWM3_9HEXA|nr:unnamed protein product [Allacma fusca]